ncbi:SpoIIE family protein phosphatase [Pseudoalteromonas sp. SSDWG2]|uniref:SpoIIE family protein phosphatase n=1 Tax=Pseudoalteromonas sp. SSDWG2 TaxID=3139391 RepID=UPI003BACB8F3
MTDASNPDSLEVPEVVPPLILVVDDEELNRTLLRIMLEHDNYSVIEASNGAEALVQLASNDVDLVLLDIMMPVMDGYVAAPKIKEHSGASYLPIIFITALEDSASLARCLDVGGDDFMPKPFEPLVLKAKLRVHLRIRELVQQSIRQTQTLTYYQNQTEREHELVEHIFANALKQPHEMPNGVDSHLSPAAMFNGDVFLSAVAPNGSQYFMLGDFTGHGLAAAIGALPISTIFYTMAAKNLAIGDIAKELNRSLAKLLPSHMFCAATLVEVNASAQSANFWLGGLPDGFIIDQQGDVLAHLESMHMALGILDDDEFERDVVHLSLRNHARIALYTDGIIEAENPSAAQYGYSRLERALKNKPRVGTSEIIADVHAFTGCEVQQDDYSVVIIDPTPHKVDEQRNKVISPLPLTLHLDLDAQQLKKLDPIAQLIDLLTNLPGLNAHKSSLFILLSEAYNNALEHGLLGLDSQMKLSDEGFMDYYLQREQRLDELTQGKIVIDVHYVPHERKVIFKLADSGDGFDRDAINLQQGYQSFGRGLSLLNELAENVTYNDKGNEVNITYVIE